MPYVGTNYSAPNLNGQATARLLYKGIMENIFQNILHLPEKGVTEKYSEDTSASEIRIIRELPVTGYSRQLGGTINGGSFNANNPEQPLSAEYGIKILYVYDLPYDIPTVVQDQIPLDLAEAAMRNIGGKVATDINASTTAHQIVASLNYNALRATANDRIVTLPESPTGENYKTALLTAAEYLDGGDEANGIQQFPYDARQIICTPGFKRNLFSTGSLIIGGSNFAQEMLARGTISPGTYKDNGRAYVGEVDSTPVMVMSPQIWAQVSNWSLTTTTATGATATPNFSAIQAIVVSGIGTGRALAFNNAVKVIDSPNGQGKRLQPLYRWGIETFYPASVVVIANNGFTNPAVSGTSTLSNIAPGNQAVNTDQYITVTGVKIGTSSSTATAATLTSGVWSNGTNLTAGTTSAYVEITSNGTTISGTGTFTVKQGNNYIQGVVTRNGAFQTVNVNVKVA